MIMFLPLYAVAFVLMFVLVRWYLLLPGAVLATAFIGWVLSGMAGASGPATFGIAMFAMPSALGFMAGFVARVIALSQPAARRTRGSSLLIGVVSFVAAPAIAYAAMTVMEERRRRYYAPPSMGCLARAQSADMAGVRLGVPLAPGVSAGNGRGFDAASLYVMSINEHARRFCADAATAPVQLTHLSLDFQRPDPAAGFCRSAQPYAWRGQACRRYDDGAPSSWPVEVTFYAIGGYDAARMLAYSVDQPGFAADDPRLRPRRPDDGVVGFDAGHDRYRAVAKRKRGVRARIVAKCFDTTIAGERPGPGLYCQAAYPIVPGIGAVYGFRTTDADFAREAVAADDGVRSIWQSLQRR